MMVRLPFKFRKVYDEAATRTLTPESLGLHHNTSASGTIVLTLPPAAKWKGLVCRFHRYAAQAFRLLPSGTEQFVNTDGSLSTASKYKELGTNGAWLELVSDGTKIFITATNGTINNQA